MSASWSTLEIAGKPADIFDPPGAHRPRFGVLFLHTVGQETLPTFPEFTRHLTELDLACICPHGDYSWWADRLWPSFDPKITAEKYLTDSVLHAFRERWDMMPPGIGLLGISMGGQGVLRLAFKYPQLFPVVAAISSALDYHEIYGQGYSVDQMYDSKEQCRQDTALMHVHPTHWPRHLFFCIDPVDRDWYRGNDRLHEKLTALGIPHEIDFTTRAGGHSAAYFNHMAGRALQFIYAGLEHESRRLL